MCALLNLYWVIVIWYFLNEWVGFFINQQLSLLYLRDFANLNRNEFKRVKCNPILLLVNFNFSFSPQITKNSAVKLLRLCLFTTISTDYTNRGFLTRSFAILHCYFELLYFEVLSNDSIKLSQMFDIRYPVVHIFYHWDCLSILKIL